MQLIIPYPANLILTPSYTIVTGNFNFLNNTRYVWSGISIATGTLPSPASFSGQDFTVKNITTGVNLFVSGIVDYSRNALASPSQAYTFGSDGLSWLIL